jgi:hypothetical protein
MLQPTGVLPHEEVVQAWKQPITFHLRSSLFKVSCCVSNNSCSQLISLRSNTVYLVILWHLLLTELQTMLLTQTTIETSQSWMLSQKMGAKTGTQVSTLGANPLAQGRARVWQGFGKKQGQELG